MTGNQKQRSLRYYLDRRLTHWELAGILCNPPQQLARAGCLVKLGKGTQSHLDFLPEAQTDFIIAVIAEEFGLIGVGFCWSFICQCLPVHYI